MTKRHFIVGDIHGRYQALQDLLASAEYDPETDIIYTVGDMIDRGPKSVEVFEFFQQPNTYSIRGNHEVMVTDPDWHNVWLANGGIQTLASLTEHYYDEAWLKAMINSLPYIIDVGEPEDEYAFRIVHAEMPPAWNEETFQFVLDSSETDADPRFAHLLWARTTITDARENVANLKPLTEGIMFHPERSGRNVFVGHTPLKRPMTVGDMTYLDTWGDGTLTMVEAITKQFYTVKVTDHTKRYEL